MIKTFEEFEKFEKKPKLKKGDYVICHTMYNTSSLTKDEINSFLDNNMGQYVKYDSSADFRYGVKYENVPHKLESLFKDEGLYWLSKDEIFDWSKNRQELELKLITKKYNI